MRVLWLFGHISHIFYVAANSNPDSVSSPSGLNGEVCPVDASGCSFAPRSSHVEIWTLFLQVLHFGQFVAAQCSWGPR